MLLVQSSIRRSGKKIIFSAQYIGMIYTNSSSTKDSEMLALVHDRGRLVAQVIVRGVFGKFLGNDGFFSSFVCFQMKTVNERVTEGEYDLSRIN